MNKQNSCKSYKSSGINIRRNARVEYRGSLIHQHRRRRKKKISAFKVFPVEVTVMSTEESGEEEGEKISVKVILPRKWESEKFKEG
ncbi:hypothetical protein AOXY_G29322 [Acipenser oxyrinchus oxyrinchus]|uniref:Uncharacterized protein n=1 Tax=Acipenser oxyrinchus oxyrinchus TaxID=40147 RepID=A0AAD8CN00_ACIOX|nr:hypothetical protein AOXY_G29322 [Acipenser oxyrinchus oxyrinchus]